MGASPMKPREERQKVMITARMRSSASWQDVCILNLSKRGLGIQAPQVPPAGSYVEICRGYQVIIGRVMWAKGHRAGLRAQDPIWIQGLLGDPSTATERQPAATEAFVERRRVPRAAQKHEDSRLAGRAMEFTFIALAAVGLGAIAFGIVEQALAGPMAQIGTALSQDSG